MIGFGIPLGFNYGYGGWGGGSTNVGDGTQTTTATKKTEKAQEGVNLFGYQRTNRTDNYTNAPTTNTSTQSTYAPQTTTSSQYSPQYTYAPTVITDSPYATSKKSLSSNSNPYLGSSPSLYAQPSQDVAQKGAETEQSGSADTGGDFMTKLLIGGAVAVVGYVVVKKVVKK